MVAEHIRNDDVQRTTIFGQIAKFVEAQARSGDTHFSLPASTLEHFERSGLHYDEIYRIVAPEEVLKPLIEKKKTLNPDQTDRASRVAFIVDLAERVFGNSSKAFMWLRHSNRQLGGSRPVDCLARESGARLVEEALLRLNHGIYA